MTLNDKQLAMSETSTWDFSDLRALFLNCTLKRTPELSHTQGLIDMSSAIMEKNGVSVEVLRPIYYDIAFGVYPDMTEHGWEADDWPAINEKVQASASQPRRGCPKADCRYPVVAADVVPHPLPNLNQRGEHHLDDDLAAQARHIGSQAG